MVFIKKLPRRKGSERVGLKAREVFVRYRRCAQIITIDCRIEHLFNNSDFLLFPLIPPTSHTSIEL